MIEVWKKARDTVEHFDKILSDFRKIAFAADAAVIPIAFQIFLTADEWPFYIALLGIAWNLVNFLIWIAEKHYHLYLITAANVARNLEKKITEDQNCWLTDRLANAKEYQCRVPFLNKTYLHFYDLIYLIFGFLGLLLSLYLNFWIFFSLFSIELTLFIVIFKKYQKVEHF